MLDLTNLRGHVEHNFPLAPHTTWRVGGPAETWAVPEDVEALLYVLYEAKEGELPVFILGNGSNVLIDDSGLPGVTLHLGSGFEDVRVDSNLLRAGAGASLSKVARTAAQAGFAGFEHLIGIPGTVGGGVVGNAGSGGCDMRHVLASVTLISESLELATMKAENLRLDYRYSSLQASNCIVTEAAFKLEHSDDPCAIQRRHEQILAKRREKFPLGFPNAGSVFKGSAGQPAGLLIEAAGLKCFKIGDAQISEKHANFIINLGRATAEDIRALIETIQERIWADFGIALEREVTFLPEHK